MNFSQQTTTSPQEFTDESVRILSSRIQDAIAHRGRCTLGLSGGSTPRSVYEALALVPDIDWSKVHIFLVDERYIDSSDDRSNQKLVRDTLAGPLDLPEEQLHFPDTSLEIQGCILEYTKDLTHLFSEAAPDIMVLGMGPDGHIASLFPPVPETAFGEVLVLHTTTDQFDVYDRISVSPLVLMSCQSHLMLLKGADKKEVWEQMLSEQQPSPVRWPALIPLATERMTVVFG